MAKLEKAILIEMVQLSIRPATSETGPKVPKDTKNSKEFHY